MSEPVHYLSMDVLHRAIRDRDISPVALVDDALRRIDRLNGELMHSRSCWQSRRARMPTTPSARLRTAAGEDRWCADRHQGLLRHGHVRTTAAFEHFENRAPATDAVSVAKLRAAGAVILGKMNTRC